MAITRDELIESLHEFDGTEYALKDVEQFVDDAIKWDVYELDDLFWFYEWEPAILSILETKVGYAGIHVEIFPNYDDFKKMVAENYGENVDINEVPDAIVRCDEGLSGVWVLWL